MTSTEPANTSATSAASAKRAACSQWTHSDRIKRESRHIFNKLHSIAADADFVRRVHYRYASLLVTANLRCGAWYTDPAITSAVSYFKSTDGHTHQWSFSLKRSNLHVVPAILRAGGAIVVDSTRRGKSMPDALSKTIPVWCAVLNAASQRKYGVPTSESEAFGLHTPTWMIPPSEHDQIRARIDGFVTALLNSDLDVPRLDKPLQPIFVTPQNDMDMLPSSLANTTATEIVPIVLLSASRFISDSANLDSYTPGGAETDGNGFVYVQGAGDDHENWARGLTPDLFWQHSDALLACEKDLLEEAVDNLVKHHSTASGSRAHWFTPRAAGSEPSDGADAANRLAGTAQGDVEVGNTGIFIGARTAEHDFSPDERALHNLIIHFTSLAPPAVSSNLSSDLEALKISDSEPSSNVYPLHMSPNKKGLLAIRTAFPPAIACAYRTLNDPASAVGSRPKILVCCQDGKDLSGSLVVAILATCFTDTRQLITADEPKREHELALTKDTTRRRLQWLVSASPRAAPSRAFLLRVNELLLSHKHKPAPT